MKKLCALLLAGIMVFLMVACDRDQNPSAGNIQGTISTSKGNEDDNDSSTETTTATEESKPEETENTDNDAIDPDFKAAMDAYEKFMDEYVAFMKKYKENPNDLSLLMDYANYLSKYTDFVESFEKWEDEDLNLAETAYYVDVQARVSKKLLEVAQ